jgi:hypothetical protein
MFWYGIFNAVNVRIHGGSLVQGTGSDPLFDGTNLAQKNVVVVTFNYRRNYVSDKANFSGYPRFPRRRK